MFTRSGALLGCLGLMTPLAFGQSSSAAEPSTPDMKPLASAPSSTETDWLTRSTLTGDWGGSRPALADRGVSFDLRHTSTYQGLASGSGPESYEYGGKVDAFVDMDSAKLGLWDGGGFRSHFEYRHGPAPATLGGAIFAVNTALYWPVGTPDELVATSLYFTQKLGDRSGIAIGKFNPVDLIAADPFFGGWGIDRFMNLVFTAPPSGLIPVVMMGAIGTLRTDPVAWSLSVYDPEDRTNDYLPGDLFETGVNVSLSGAHVATLAGRKTRYTLTGIYSTAEGIDYSSLAPGLQTTTKKGSYNVSFEFRHNLQESAAQPDANWGFYLKAAIADGNPNYVQSSLIAGIGGRALFFGRPQDAFGIGAFHYNLSDSLESSLSANSRFRDETAIEAFYSVAVTPWLHVGADIQYIRPALGSFKNALIPALRTQVRF